MSDTINVESQYDQSRELENLMNRLESEVLRTLDENTLINTENIPPETHNNHFKYLNDHNYSLRVIVNPEPEKNDTDESNLEMDVEFNEEINSQTEASSNIKVEYNESMNEPGEFIFVNEIMADHTYSICPQDLAENNIEYVKVKEEQNENIDTSTEEAVESMIAHNNIKSENNDNTTGVSMDQIHYGQGYFLQGASFRITEDGTLESLEPQTTILHSNGLENQINDNDSEEAEPQIEILPFEPREPEALQADNTNLDVANVKKVKSIRRLVKIPDSNLKRILKPKGKKTLMWSDCGYKYIQKMYLENHNLWVNFDIFGCSICSFKTKKSITLINHFKREHCGDQTVNEGIMYRCSHCKFMAKAKPLIIKHIKARHSKAESTLDESYKNFPKLFKCEECNYQTNYKSNLRVHLKNMHNAILITPPKCIL